MMVADLSDKKFGLLKPIRYERRKFPSCLRTYWLCVCDCGEEKWISATHLTAGTIRSCGCLGRESRFKHGQNQVGKRSRAYRIWSEMIQRCTNKKSRAYSSYGGRGITVCDEWFSFINFYRDMGDPPSGHSIDRRNNSEGYSKANCRWATGGEQMRNTRRTRVIEFGGKKMCLTDWAASVGMTPHGLIDRFNRGWSIEKALTTQNKEK